jgi:peroxiredoxin
MEEITPIRAGEYAPDFTLTDVFVGESFTLSQLRGHPLILNFWSTECPWSRKFDDYFLERHIQWAEQGIGLLFIDSNENEAVYEMQDLIDELGISTPVLPDPRNEVADAYGAITTPHIFLIAASGLIIYQGAVDDRSFRQPEATINYLDAAVDALQKGQPPDPSDTLAYGCTIVRYFGE